MPKKRTLDQLHAEQAAVEKQIEVKLATLKALKKEEKELIRKQRNHRLIVHGGKLEHYLSPDKFNEAQIDWILQAIFQQSETSHILSSALKQPDLERSLSQSDLEESGSASGTRT
ncbi:MAG: DUF3847 domain-containing protein [Oscillospiraceae bacterium]|nr:DUF3847 domain-containing protein [Oscillospiraceae bacterium]